MHDWSDFYNFTFGGNYILATVAALAITAVIYMISALFANAYNRRLSEGSTPEIILPKNSAVAKLSIE